MAETYQKIFIILPPALLELHTLITMNIDMLPQDTTPHAMDKPSRNRSTNIFTVNITSNP